MLEKLANLEGIVVEVLREDAIDPGVFSGLDLRSRAVLVRTGWSERWGGPNYFRSGPFLTADACRLLVEVEVALVGIDCANVDDMADPARSAHTICSSECRLPSAHREGEVFC